MCGLAGYFAKGGLRPEEGAALVARMLEAIHHRGPDDRGQVIEPTCGVGSTRLSIVDIEGGHLPMEDASAGLVLAYNGELYDHARHRAALEAEGHRFHTRSDAEVLLPLYQRHGADAPQQVAGMFAFALWDAQARRLLLGRDRFGIKPLFLADSDDGRLLLFASEVKALFASGLVAPRMDARALQDVLTAGYPMPPRTAFVGVRALPPGTVLEVQGTERRAHRYHRVAYPNRDTPKSRVGKAEAVEAFRARFDEVVKDHLMADVPVASYLSGGIDSVSVAARARVHAPQLNTFSMTFGGADARYDESSHSDLAARHLGIEAHHRVPLAEIGEADFVGTVRAMEAPQVHTVAFCLYQLARAVRDAGFKVVLSGEGADEVLAGYRAFRIARLRRVLGGRWGFVRRGLVRLFLSRSMPDFSRALLGWWGEEPRVAQRFGLVPPWVEQWWLLRDAAAPLLAPELAFGAGVEALPEPPADLALLARAPLHNDLLFEQASRLDGWVLGMGDRLSMAHSVEARVPFLDHRLVDLAASLPPRRLLKGTNEKWILRAAMQGDLPPALAQRRKRAFMAPSTEWLFGASPPGWVQDALSPARLAAAHVFDPKAVAKALARVPQARGLEAMALGMSLTAVLSTVIWAEQFAVGDVRGP
ncbi:MAG: asparagine synthase (glutamine-hydrolyzing) [Myxococcales bacterium]|nr:asparagine synthase (glutamine-hydrolyzing) [Myxococcales bacterium]